MQFITLSRRVSERFSDADFAPFLDAEAQRARALYLEGFIRTLWHRGDMGGACLLVEADSEAGVREQLATLPLVNNGMLEVTAIVPLKPYAGFGPRTE
ncbi:muconolactone Delta-isomerase family protein [Pseudomonas sp. BIGb0164]|uniref:muconolactone Delta-isomerase family protein n=1 Tax=Pseudomonas sp. BIGb0164 TaxID=2940605 RepID=UPI0021683CE1|nr:muconolactone Delta-isomerase family protein [Pseudomonas sp. BIGb0164]MCS4246276.1 muconolactone delta-isomerase [Pseudomonas sp. BIGb0164]